MAQARTEGTQARSAPVAMGKTRLGTVYLQELEVEDLEAYTGAPGASARARLGWLLPRIAGKTPTPGFGGELSDAEIASLDEQEVETLVETYLASPDNQRHAAEAARGVIPMVRGGGESAVSYLDRLVRWRVQMLRSPAPVEVDGDARVATSRTVRAAAPDTSSRVLAWFVMGLAVAIAASAFGAYLTWHAAVRNEEERAARERWQADMKALIEWNAATQATAANELTEEIARLRKRLESAEARLAPPAAPPKAAARSSAPKPSQARKDPRR